MVKFTKDDIETRIVKRFAWVPVMLNDLKFVWLRDYYVRQERLWPIIPWMNMERMRVDPREEFP